MAELFGDQIGMMAEEMGVSGWYAPAMTAARVRDALDSVSKDNFGEFESTEWSVVFDQSALTATYYHRENYEKAYPFRLLEKGTK